VVPTLPSRLSTQTSHWTVGLASAFLAQSLRDHIMIDLIRRALTQLGVLSGHPLAFLIFFAYVAAWLVFEPETFDWHGIATIVVWIMTLFIQRAENRDTQSIQAKLDELLHAHSLASNAMTRIDEEQPEDIEQHRKDARKDD
jgi:low affinity Fe/Cu permease